MQSPTDSHNQSDDGFYLGIESSCDDLGVAIHQPSSHICVDALRSSSVMHIPAGGIVPEIAARDHSGHLLKLVDECINQARIPSNKITAIGYTRGPGLIGSLMVGAAFAKSLGYAWSIPTLGIHHLEGHLCATLLDISSQPPEYPYLALLVSGGHSHLFRVDRDFCYTLLGATRDDAAGEAFDKCATMLGIDYPGGADLSTLARGGNPQRFDLPRPMCNHPGYDLSFSGLKTAVRYTLDKLNGEACRQQTRQDLAAAIETAIVDCLLTKLELAIRESGIARVLVAGGVSANSHFRERLAALQLKRGVRLWLPPLQLCTDNGAMIACATARRYAAGFRDQDTAIKPVAVWPLDSLE